MLGAVLAVDSERLNLRAELRPPEQRVQLHDVLPGRSARAEPRHVAFGAVLAGQREERSPQ
jgi:hypothetical protein